MSEKILEVKHLCRIYGKGKNACHALKDVSFTVERGEFVGIMGASGAGKTTLLNLISSIDRPTKGEIIIDGENILQMDDANLAKFRGKKMGFLFQDYNLLTQMTIGENITLPMALNKMSADKQKERMMELAKTLHIEDKLNEMPVALSGGQRQRAAAARALAMKPAIVLADEPTGALDSQAGTELMECLSQMNRLQKATIVMVTHSKEAAKYCSRIISIKDGMLVEEKEIA